MLIKKILASAASILMTALLTISPVWAEMDTEPAAQDDSDVIAYAEADDDETDDTETEDTENKINSAIKEYSVFEAIRIRRDLIENGGNYTIKDYTDLSTYLVNASKLSIRIFTITYDTEGADTSDYKDPTVLESTDVAYKSSIKVLTASLNKDGYINSGWEYDGVVYTGGMYFRMPANDVVFKPVWHKRCSVTYLAGDYDDIVGNDRISYMSAEKSNIFLAEAGRFSRNGYTISGWMCENDGVEYKPNSAYKVPSEDVVFTAVWSPASYELSISAKNGNSSDKETISVKYNEEFVFPECKYENNGKTFAGWKYNNALYQPGDSFVVPAMLSGSKIVITAVWE